MWIIVCLILVAFSGGMLIQDWFSKRKPKPKKLTGRYIQDRIANCLNSNIDYINPFLVL